MELPPDSDEGRHPPTDEASTEAWQLDFWSADGDLGGYVCLTLHPASGRSAFWACVAGADRPLVTVLEHDAPIPRPPGLELRCSGLWADLIVETPWRHVTVGLEAFGVALDPSEVFGRGWGDRTPLGFDLEWESSADDVAAGATGYDVPCVVHGEILVADEVIDLDGFGHRRHTWGGHDGWSDASIAATGRFGGGDGWWAHMVPEFGWVDGRGPDGAELVAGSATHTVDVRGLVTSATVRMGEVELTAEPVAAAPVAVATPAGLGARWARTLVRWQDADGARGVGWYDPVLPHP